MKALLALALVAASVALSGATAVAAPGRWCAVYESAEGGKNCGFTSYRQCMADVQGKGGRCMRDTSR